MKTSVLLIGESWMTHITEAKGVDIFSYDHYETCTQYIEKALSTDTIEFHHLPSHLIQTEFPQTAEALKEKYDVVLISDVGANTFLLPAQTFLRFQPTPNKLELLKQFVKLGGGLCMVGGYLSFMGLDGKARYYHTPVEEVLPVDFFPYDDRRELPQGAFVTLDPQSHPILKDWGPKMPMIFGYNQAVAKADAQVLIAYQGDPILTVREYGNGRTMAFAVDCAPHWCPVEFCESSYYRAMWQSMVRWLAKK